MKQETLIHIKQQIKALVPLLESYRDCGAIKEGLITAMIVEIGNAAGKWADCQGYTIEKDADKLATCYRWIMAVKHYEADFHFIQYICDEFHMTYTGNMMAEADEEQQALEDSWRM